MVWRYPTRFPPPSHASSTMPPPPLPLTFSWMLCPSIKWWPSKAKTLPSLYFLMCFVCAPQISDPTPASANSKARTLSILFWGDAEPRFGATAALSMEREQSRWVGWWQLLKLIVVCVFVVVFCVWEQLIATIPVESQHRQRRNGHFLHTHITKSAPKVPKYKLMCKIVVIRRYCTCFDLLVKVSVGPTTSAQKAR